MRGSRLIGGAAIAGVVLACLPVVAQQTAPQGERPGGPQGRYSMSPAEGSGFIRLDTESGRMSLCQRRDADWTCREMAEPGGGLNQEIDRLRTENQRLKAELRQMEDIMLGDKRGDGAQRPDGRGGGGGGGSSELRLPSEQDIDNAMSYVQRMLRKFREKMKELESEGKGTPL